ncbi:MAG: RNA polymerase sigma factor [Patescibacteria group bacterium]|nr:MAG: RNA polymerase sigma factor [Patescibacteria group bacterium]
MTIFGGEEALFTRLRKYKDKQAFIEAYNLYIDQIYRFVYYKVRGRETAEDLTSLVFLKAWNYVYEGNLDDDQDTLKPLLYKIARNTVIDHYRKTSKQESVSLEAMVENEENLPSQVVVDPRLKLQDGVDFRQLVEETLPQLKDEYREIVIMRFINELSIAEIANILDKTSGNVRVLVHRSLEALRKLVKS